MVSVVTARPANALARPDESHPLAGRAFTFTLPRSAASEVRIASRCGASLGARAITVTSRARPRQPVRGHVAGRRCAGARSSRPSSARRCREVLPMSPMPAAPSSASMMAWVSTSARNGRRGPARGGCRRRRGSGPPGQRHDVDPDPGPTTRHPIGSRRGCGARRRSARRSRPARAAPALVVAVADVLGQVGVARERDRQRRRRSTRGRPRG